MVRTRGIVLSLAMAAGLATAAPAHLAALPASAVAVGPAPTRVAAPGMAKAGERLGLWLPGGVRAFTVESVQEFANGDAARTGALAGGGAATVTLGREGGFGRAVVDGRLWLLEFRDGATYAVKVGAGGLALADDDAGPLELPAVDAPKHAPRTVASGSAKAANGFRTIDVFQLYDPEFAARYPGGLLQTRLNHLVALANQAFVDSGIRAVLRQVGSQRVDGVLDGAIAANLSAMQAALEFDADFAGIRLRELRRAFGADLIALHRTHDMYARGACGIAYLPSAITDSTGVSVTDDGASLGSVCDDLVLTHEIGHNLGARHQVADDGTPGEAHGFVLPGRFHTIMGTFGTGHPDRYLRIPFFSNPRMACGGTACGQTGGADNAAAISDNLERIAGMMAKKVSGEAVPPAQSAPDSDGDGVVDRLDAFPHDPARDADRDGDGVADADDRFPDNGNEWADTDGGGQGDRADGDDDNDGFADLLDACPNDPRDHLDGDGDGVCDSQDAFPADPLEDRDSDGDGTGDRADADDDQDGTVDLGDGASRATSELLVVDGATARVLRFRGSDLAPLGTLLQMAEGDVSARSGLAVGAAGELWVIAGPRLVRIDRLRGEQRTLIDAYTDPAIAAGFPLSPIVPVPDEVAFGEFVTSRFIFTERWRAAPRQFAFGSVERKRLALMPDGRVIAVDGATGSLTRYRYDTAVASRFVLQAQATQVQTGLVRPGAAAVAADGSVYVVEESTGAVRRFDGYGALTPVGGFSAPVGAVAVAIGPDGAVWAALAAGGVRRLDPVTGADLGLALSATAAAAPLNLAWAPSIADTDLAPRAPAPAPAGADPTTTPAVGGTPLPPAPSPLAPCVSGCTGGGGGGGGGSAGADLALWAALALAWSRRRRAISS